jgi:hypothetical protein
MDMKKLGIMIVVCSVMLLLGGAQSPAFAACKICTGSGCQNATDSSGRENCLATSSGCSIWGNTCTGGGCEVTCPPENPEGFLLLEEPWQLTMVDVVGPDTDEPPSVTLEDDWVLAMVKIERVNDASEGCIPS